jgi:hypothetical protein
MRPQTVESSRPAQAADQPMTPANDEGIATTLTVSLGTIVPRRLVPSPRNHALGHDPIKLNRIMA